MKVLVLSSVFPYPPSDGDRLRIYNFIKEISKKNKIYLISFIKKGEEEFIKEINKYCKAVYTVYISRNEIILKTIFAFLTGKAMNVFSYYKKEMQILINDFLKNNSIDAIFAYRIRMAQYVENVKIPKIVDFVDSLAFYMKEKMQYEKNLFTYFYLLFDNKRVLLYEKKMIEKFDYALVNYEGDKNFLNGKNVFVLSNGVYYDEKKSYFKKPEIVKKIGFFGDMNYSPNKDGIYFFYKMVWKKIEKSDKNLQLIIAGKSSERLNIKGNNIIKTGYLKNLDAEIKTWDLCVVPVRYGAGRQNKILKAWLNKVPVVATSFAVKGIYGRDFFNILIADTPDEFIDRINILLNDNSIRKKIIKNGYLTLKKHFNWKKTGALLNKLLWRLK